MALSRDRLGDIGIVSVAVALGALVLVGEASTTNSAVWPLEFTIGPASCLGLLFLRRRWPLALAVTMLPVSLLLSAGSMGVTAMAIFNLAIRRRWQVAVSVAAAYAVAMASLWRLAELSEREYWETIVTIQLAHALLVAAGMLLRSHRMLVESLQARAQQAEVTQRLQVEEARHREREELAREMHDVLAHRISLLAVYAGALEVRRDVSDEETQAAAVIRQAAYDALEDLRQVLGVLRSDGTDANRPQPTLADIPTLVEDACHAGESVALDYRIGDDNAVPTAIGRHAYRVVQEGLTNARKHASGARVWVHIGATDAELTVDVGQSAAAAQQRHSRSGPWSDRVAGTYRSRRRPTPARPHGGRRLRAPRLATVAP